MSDLLLSSTEVLRSFGYAVSTFEVEGRTAAGFEDETTLGFVFAYADVDELCSLWARAGSSEARRRISAGMSTASSSGALWIGRSVNSASRTAALSVRPDRAIFRVAVKSSSIIDRRTAPASLIDPPPRNTP